MNQLKPESLKKIAEVLGYASDIFDGRVKISFAPFIFDPKNNPAQRWEIVEKFEMDLTRVEGTYLWEAEIFNPEYISFKNENLTEAVLAAAEEFVK